jgi:hypothetical protein
MGKETKKLTHEERAAIILGFELMFEEYLSAKRSRSDKADKEFRMSHLRKRLFQMFSAMGKMELGVEAGHSFVREFGDGPYVCDGKEK